MNKREDLRNIAIVAHVDHGKTTLVDQMLNQSGTVKEISDRVMDSGDIEKERGITILAKNTSLKLKNGKTINIVDTPGHMDFGGEVERTLKMVEGFILLVDAAEGVLPGTRFVLEKSLKLNLKPIVVINKIDRKDADIERVESEIHNLFLDIAIDESQLDFPILYGSSKNGFVSTSQDATGGTMEPLFETIVENIPAPEQATENFQFLVTNLDYSDYFGRIAVGRIFGGKISTGKDVVVCVNENLSKPTRITKIFAFEGTNRTEIEEAQFGDIVALAGFNEELPIGATVCLPENPEPMEYVKIDEPTVSVMIGVNKSAFAGKEGKLLTSRQIYDRLLKELKTNVALRVEQMPNADVFKVSGRGQLHIGILLETMRREGFEMEVSAPEVVIREIDGKQCEPMELLVAEVNEEFQGTVIEKMSERKASLQNMEVLEASGRVKMEFKIPSRGLLGLRSQFLTDTRGTGALSSRFIGYEPKLGEIERRKRGALFSMENGTATGYSLDSLQARGILFIGPGQPVYKGMIIGEHSRDNDLPVNPTKGKKLTNMRAAGSDDSVQLATPKEMKLEASFDWIREDELIEITPENIRLRKKK